MDFKFLRFFKSKEDNTGDKLGRYPEYMQVRALPERRYIKTSRILTVVIIFNIAGLLLFAGLFTYTADRADIKITGNNATYLFSIDSSRYMIEPVEYETKKVYALELFIESILRDYIVKRHAIEWDTAEMQSRWDITGPIGIYSNFKTVYPAFRIDADRLFSQSRANHFVRDVHLYDLKAVHNNLWEGVFEVFDMPVPDAYAPICDCTDNGPDCIACKKENALKRSRFKVLLRVKFSNTKTMKNPLGLMVDSYNLFYQPIDENQTYWGVPNDLKPDL